MLGRPRGVVEEAEDLVGCWMSLRVNSLSIPVAIFSYCRQRVAQNNWTIQHGGRRREKPAGYPAVLVLHLGSFSCLFLVILEMHRHTVWSHAHHRTVFFPSMSLLSPFFTSFLPSEMYIHMYICRDVYA